MNRFREIFYFFTIGCGTILILITLLSQLNSSHWYLEILTFPRLQVLIALPVIGVISYLLKSKRNVGFIVFICGLTVAALLQVWILFPYTPFAPRIAKSIPADKVSEGSRISIVVANVLMNNRNADELIKMINKKDPALLLTMEVDNWWIDQLRVLKKKYPYSITFPTDNTYGMALYSQYPLTDAQVLFLTNTNVPSIRCNVTITNGKRFQLLAIHPVAPKPSEHPDNMGEKENGLLKAAYLVSNLRIPTMVAGDFNDVGWSYNTSQFLGYQQVD